MIMHLLACASPLVLTRRIPKKLINVPGTGSTVLLRSFLMRFALSVAVSLHPVV